MHDFVWGLQQRGHAIQVLTSDAPHLGLGGSGPSGEPVDRRLKLKGSFKNGVNHLQDPTERNAVDAQNRRFLTNWLHKGVWDGVILGNLDLLGPEILKPLLESGLYCSIGFVTPPYPTDQMPPKQPMVTPEVNSTRLPWERECK